MVGTIRPGRYWRGCLLASLVFPAAGTVACVPQPPDFGPVPADVEASESNFMDLADIPPAPGVPPASEVNESVEALTKDRAIAAQAASALRQEPFVMPQPAPLSGP